MKNGDWKRKYWKSFDTQLKIKENVLQKKKKWIECVKTKESPRVKNGESERGE